MSTLRLVVLALLITTATTAAAAIYEVGPGEPYASIGSVPWEVLVAGDTVLIHWRPEVYREKWVLSRQGTVQNPITVRGVAGPNGERPIIDGEGATTRVQLDYWSEGRGILKIGGSSIPPDVMPRHLRVEGLEFRNARAPLTFFDDNGAVQSYQANASGIFLEKGEHVAIRDCVFRNHGNGLFVASSDDAVSRDLLIEGNYFHDNGNPGSIFEHNVYTAASGIVFQFNRFGPLCSGCNGNNLKDRSAGLVVRYNWIEGGNRQLDLVDAEDSSLIRAEPTYRETLVYGNVLIEPDGAGNRQIAHYGGDSGNLAGYRKGVLSFYNNTVVSKRTGRTTLMRLSTNDEHCDARNNIFYAAATNGADLSLLDFSGTLDWTHNWIEPGWVVTFGSFEGSITDAGTSVEGTVPGFVNESLQDYHLTAVSSCRDAATSLAPWTLPLHDVAQVYVAHQSGSPRPADGQLDIGAYEFCSAAAPGPVLGLSMAADLQTLMWDPVAAAVAYHVVRGNLLALLASAGDFSSSVTSCSEEDAADALASDAAQPGIGQAFFYLVRAVTCGGAGTYDEGDPAQQGSRDAEIPPCVP